MWHKFFGIAMLISGWMPAIVNATEEHPRIAVEMLPMSLQTSWNANKPHLGKFGHCAAASTVARMTEKWRLRALFMSNCLR